MSNTKSNQNYRSVVDKAIESFLMSCVASMHLKSCLLYIILLSIFSTKEILNYMMKKKHSNAFAMPSIVCGYNYFHPALLQRALCRKWWGLCYQQPCIPQLHSFIRNVIWTHVCASCSRVGGRGPARFSFDTNPTKEEWVCLRQSISQWTLWFCFACQILKDCFVFACTWPVLGKYKKNPQCALETKASVWRRYRKGKRSFNSNWKQF